MIAAHDPDHRAGLLTRIAEGGLDALQSFGKVTDLPKDVAAGIISVLEGQILERVAVARSGSIKISGRDPLQTLVLMNAWHPDVARWDACCTALSEPLVIGEYTVPAIEMLGRLSGEIPKSVAERLRGPLEVQASRAPRDHEFRVFSTPADPRGPARRTIALLFPDDVSDEDLLTLLRGEAVQRNPPPSASQLTLANPTTSHSSRRSRRTNALPCVPGCQGPCGLGQAGLSPRRAWPNSSIRS